MTLNIICKPVLGPLFYIQPLMHTCILYTCTNTYSIDMNFQECCTMQTFNRSHCLLISLGCNFHTFSVKKGKRLLCILFSNYTCKIFSTCQNNMVHQICKFAKLYIYCSDDPVILTKHCFKFFQIVFRFIYLHIYQYGCNRCLCYLCKSHLFMKPCRSVLVCLITDPSQP